MNIDTTTLIVLIFLVPLIVWSVFLMAKSLAILARGRGEARTLAGLAAAPSLEGFVTHSVLMGYFLASIGWISWPDSNTQNLWGLFAVLTMIFTLLAPLFFRHWSNPELKRLHAEIRRLALARGGLIITVVLLGFGVVVWAVGLLSQPYGFWNGFANAVSLVILFTAWILTARGLLGLARVLTQLQNLNPVQARV
jgi:hypothetical protein